MVICFGSVHFPSASRLLMDSARLTPSGSPKNESTVMSLLKALSAGRAFAEGAVTLLWYTVL
jgi:hypothetical protein